MRRFANHIGIRCLTFLLIVSVILVFGWDAAAQAGVDDDGDRDREEGVRFIVTFKSASLPDHAEEMVRQAGGQIVDTVPQVGLLEVETSRPKSFIEHILNETEVEGLAPSVEIPHDADFIKDHMEPSTVDGDHPGPVPVGESIWDTGWQWDVERVTRDFMSFDLHQGTHDVVVGVIDSGFDFSHPDLAPNIIGGSEGSRTFVPGTDDAWDQKSHGTHVAGTIAANGRVKGVAPGVGLRAYRVFGEGGAQQTWIIKAIIAAADDGVDVINMSLGGTRVIGQYWYTDPETGERMLLGNRAADYVAYNRAIHYAVQRDVTIVVSGGNNGLDLRNPAKLAKWYNEEVLGPDSDYQVTGTIRRVPTQLPGVITVSSTGGGFGTEDRLSYFSNYGSGVIDLAAPGGDVGPGGHVPPEERAPDAFKYRVLSTVPTYATNVWTPSGTARALFGEDGYGWKMGTSMAAPKAAGAAAAYISKEYQETGKKPKPKQVQNHLQRTAESKGNGYDEQFGHGLLDLYEALAR